MKKTSVKKSSLLTKYSLQYEKKPKSRVFAPLAEVYRKLGMYDEALEILRSGIKYHPDYTLGYIVLAHVYFDKENYEIAYSTLRPFISKNLENITLQKLFTEICLNLGFLEEALQTLKCLLLINPKDEEVAKQVKLLEDDLLVPEENEIPTGYIEKREESFSEDDDWVQVDFNRPEQRKEDELDSWNMEKVENISPIENFKNDIEAGNLEVSEQDLDDDYFHEEHDIESNDVISSIDNEQVEDTQSPIITHTLVDLYCQQGYFEKALELLDSIIEAHPNDTASLERREEIRSLLSDGHEDIQSHGHAKLLDLVEDQKLNIDIEDTKSEKIKKIETMLTQFATSIREKSIRFTT